MDVLTADTLADIFGCSTSGSETSSALVLPDVGRADMKPRRGVESQQIAQPDRHQARPRHVLQRLTQTQIRRQRQRPHQLGQPQARSGRRAPHPDRLEPAAATRRSRLWLTTPGWRRGPGSGVNPTAQRPEGLDVDTGLGAASPGDGEDQSAID